MRPVWEGVEHEGCFCEVILNILLRMSDIKEKIKNFPKAPGVYQFLDKSGGVLYVGKAKSLKSRIKSYFLKEVGRGPAIDSMVANAVDAKYIETDSEIEAILLESDLIKQLKPKYNSRSKDDKSFFVIKISKSTKNLKLKNKNKAQSPNDLERSQFPCVELVRYKNVDFSDRSADYYGPYPAGLMLKKSLRYLRKIFPFRDCSKSKWHTYAKKGRPCIYGDIGICTGPCAHRVSAVSYIENITYLKKFLRGGKKEIIKKLEREMAAYSKEKEYEEASVARDKLSGLLHIKNVAVGLRDDVFSPAGALFKRIECYDIANIGSDYAVGAMVVVTEGKTDKDEYRKFKIQNEGSNSDRLKASDLSRLQEILERRFQNDWKLPDLVVIDGGPAQLSVAKKVLQNHHLDLPAVAVSKGPQRKKNDFHFGDEKIAQYIKHNKNIEDTIISARDEAHRFAISYYRSLHRKGMFQ